MSTLAAALALSSARLAHAQVGIGFPVTTMPSPTAPSPTPAPAQPSSGQLPPPAAPPPPSAPAAEDETKLDEAHRQRHFGQRGQVVLSGQLSADIGFLSYDQSSASSSSASIEPAFEYFFADGLLVGASLFVRYEGRTSELGFRSSTNTVGGSARFGVNLPVGQLLSFEPAFGIGFLQAQTSFDRTRGGVTTSVGGAAVPVGPDVDETAVFVSVYAPLLVHPATHVFLGIGPNAFRDLTHPVSGSGVSANTRRTFIGVSSIVGAWF